MKPAILFVSYYYSPELMSGTRNYYLSRLLAEIGYEVHIIGPANKEIIQYTQGTRIYFHGINAWDYKIFFKWLGVKDGITSNFIRSSKIIKWGHNLLLKYPFNLLFGVGSGIYLKKSIKMGSEIIRSHNIKIVYSSFMPLNDHFIAHKLKSKFSHIKWIADFRDLLWWQVENPNYSKKWITQLMSNMDSITTVTKGLASFYERVSKQRVYTVYNGLPYLKSNILPQKDYEDKFVMNYSGRIYTEFQQANILFKALKELMEENSAFKEDLILRYSGINKLLWNIWLKENSIYSNYITDDQLPLETAWNRQLNAQINILLTWTTKDIFGFIHGKFNEYVLVRNPILCLIHGNRDLELEEIYSKLSNSLIVTNDSSEIIRIKNFVLSIYDVWKMTNQVPKLDDFIIESYNWELKSNSLIELIENFKVH